MLSSTHQAIFLSDFLIVLWPLKLEKCRLIFILRSTCDMNDNESDANTASFSIFLEIYINDSWRPTFDQYVYWIRIVTFMCIVWLSHWKALRTLLEGFLEPFHDPRKKEDNMKNRKRSLKLPCSIQLTWYTVYVISLKKMLHFEGVTRQ